MKSILISIKPKWCAKIMNGEKTVEVRKGTALYKAITKLIEQYGEATIYLYCTKDKLSLAEYLFKDGWGYNAVLNYDYAKSIGCAKEKLNGKVVACFKCKKVERFEYNTCSRDIAGYWLDNGELFKLKGTCLTEDEFTDYIKFDDGTAIYISNLEIFNKPKELSEFYKRGFDEAQSDLAMDLLLEDDNCPYEHAFIKLEPQFRLTKAPQSYMFIEVGE